MNPLVSIILPCYNHEKYLESCSDSIIEQTYDNIEIIICDDFSIDDSYKIIKSKEYILKKKFQSVLILKNNSNCGITQTLNKMIKMAKGIYIKILATDDMLVPNAIEMFVEYSINNDCDVLYSNAYCIEENDIYSDCINRTDQFKLYYSDSGENNPTGYNLTTKLCSKCFIAAPAAFIPKQTFNNYGLYDETLYIEDWEFWLRVSVNGNFGYLDKPTVFYRIGTASMSRNLYNNKSERELAKIKNRKYSNTKITIFEKYKEFSSRDIIKGFYNNELRNAISVSDLEFAKEIKLYMKKERISIQMDNKLLEILQLLGIFDYIKKIKNEIVK